MEPEVAEVAEYCQEIVPDKDFPKLRVIDPFDVHLPPGVTLENLARCYGYAYSSDMVFATYDDWEDFCKRVVEWVYGSYDAACREHLRIKRYLDTQADSLDFLLYENSPNFHVYLNEIVVFEKLARGFKLGNFGLPQHQKGTLQFADAEQPKIQPELETAEAPKMEDTFYGEPPEPYISDYERASEAWRINDLEDKFYPPQP